MSLFVQKTPNRSQKTVAAISFRKSFLKRTSMSNTKIISVLVRENCIGLTWWKQNGAILFYIGLSILKRTVLYLYDLYIQCFVHYDLYICNRPSVSWDLLETSTYLFMILLQNICNSPVPKRFKLGVGRRNFDRMILRIVQLAWRVSVTTDYFV